MNGTPNSTDRMLSILVVVATITTLIFNALAGSGRLNGVMTNEVSDKYPTVLTPAGYAFSIWGLIYFGLVAFTIYQLLPSKLERLRSVRLLYVVSCVLNCGWLYAWHSYAIGICVILLFALLATLALINIKLKTAESAREALLTKAPFGIYFGWVTAASIVNFVIYLRSIDVQMSASAWNTLGCIFIAAALIAAVIVRVKLRNFLYPLAVAWAATGIAIEQQGNTAIILACAICVIFCLVLSLSFVMDLKTTTHE